MIKVELTGEYHADCNMLMARLEEAESWRSAHAREAIALAKAWEKRDAAQAYLAEAVGLLRFIKSYLGEGESQALIGQLEAFLARHDQNAGAAA